MKLSEKDIELIERAVLGKLTEDEKPLFHTKSSNEAFRQEWKIQQAMLTVIENKAKAKLKDELKALETESDSPSNFAKPHRFWWWIAILTLLILATTSVYYFQFKTSQPEDLYIAYYQPYPNEIDPVTKSTSEQGQSAYQYYEIGNYDDAISKFVPILSNKDARWYYAQTMLAIGDANQARDLLSQFMREKDESYGVHATWYLALLNIKEGKIDEARKQLIELKNADHRVYRNKAKEILSQLKG